MTVDSACSNRLPSLKFVGDTLSVSALISLVTLSFDLEPGARYARGWGGNLPTNSCVSGTFSYRHMAHGPTAVGLRDLVTLTYNLTPLTSTWPHLNSDVGLEEGEY